MYFFENPLRINDKYAIIKSPEKIHIVLRRKHVSKIHITQRYCINFMSIAV